MIRRGISIACVLVAVLSASAPAVAEEEAEPAPASLESLRRAITAELSSLSSPAPLPDEELASFTEFLAGRIDLVVGEARVEAARRVLWLFPALGLTEYDLLVGGSDALMARSEGEAPSLRWEIRRVADRWARLEALLDELRGLGAEWGPHRVCPVGGDLWFENDWHDPRPGGRAHLGIDVHGETGTPLLAVEAGTVIQANWHRAGGRQIFFVADSTGDVYFYAHLLAWSEWIWTGTRVEPGDVIGLLGSSGNAHSPHLHFGWMPGSGRLDLTNLKNPYPLLVEWCL